MEWTAENSPYTLVGNVVVPEGCTLTLEAGTEVIGNDYDIRVFGSFEANGEEGGEIQITVGELVGMGQMELELNYTDVFETADYSDAAIGLLNSEALAGLQNVYELDELVPDEYFDSFSVYQNENSDSHLGRYQENWDDYSSSGWYKTGDVSSWSTDSYFEVYGGYCCADPGYEQYIYSPTYDLETDWVIDSLSVDFSKSSGSGSSPYCYLEVQFDNLPWQVLYYSADYSIPWTTLSVDFSILSVPIDAGTLKFRARSRYRSSGTLRVDNFSLFTSAYPGVDVAKDDFLPSTRALGHSGLEMNHSSWNGSFHVFSPDTVNIILDSSIISSSSSGGVTAWVNQLNLNSVASSFLNNSSFGIRVHGELTWVSVEDVIASNGGDGVDAGANSNLSLFGLEIWNNGARGLMAADGSVIDLDYARIDGNGSHGVDLENTGTLNMDNCRLLNNGGQAIQSGSPIILNHCNLAFNGGTGLVLTGNNFHTLNNSILWGNNETNYTQIDVGGGVISTSYSTVQGQSGYGVTGSGQFYWGEGVIEADPLFADDDLHLNTYSPCVDGGQPWLMDAHMPYGLGGVRADMGMYGGPDNGYWGGLALPDGASNLQAVEDSPQDQGNTVGLTFSSSFYDNSDLVNNVTHYAFWRHFDPTGEPCYGCRGQLGIVG